MPSWSDPAGTLQRVVDSLSSGWTSLTPAQRDELSGLVQTYGPPIAGDRITTLSRINFMLGELWDRRAWLPPTAVVALQSGQGFSALRGGGALAPDARDRLLAGLLSLVDFRGFADAPGLAAQLVTLVDDHLDRLTGEERLRWAALKGGYAQSHDAAGFLNGAEDLLKDYPPVRALIEGGKTLTPPAAAATPNVRRGLLPAHPIYREMLSMARAEPPEPSPAGPTGAEPDAGALPTAGGAPPDTGAEVDSGSDAAGAGEQAVERYANVHFPATVLLSQQQAPLILHIAAQAEQGSRVSAEAGHITVQVGDLTIVLLAEGFDLDHAIGGRAVAGVPSARIVGVTSGQDCEPVIFFLNPQSTGDKKISLDVYQNDRRITTLSFQTAIVEQAPAGAIANVAVVPVPVISAGPGALPPDLELRVMLAADRRTLSYYLHSPAGADYNFKPAGQVQLDSDPQTFLQPKFDKLSALARKTGDQRQPAETDAARQELANIGQALYDSLFSPELKAEYRGKLRDKYQGKSLLITSDEPWIPWEMVRPFEADADGNTLYDDEPLCQRFRVSRWLAGRGAPDQLLLKNGVWIAPADNLAAAQVESDYFAALHRQQWQVSLNGPLSALADVQAQFQGGATQLYHFACHGNFNTDDPNESRLKLGSDFLRPSQIVGALRAGLLRSKPLVFLNACYSADTGFALTQLGGWAQCFFDAGASAFVGSLWEINDTLAAQFAQEFYNRLWGLAGFQAMPLGQAFYEARLCIKQADEANPTWLAYVLYGDPQGQVTLPAPPK